MIFPPSQYETFLQVHHIKQDMYLDPISPHKLFKISPSPIQGHSRFSMIDFFVKLLISMNLP